MFSFVDTLYGIAHKHQKREALEKNPEQSLLARLDPKTKCEFQWFSPNTLMSEDHQKGDVAMYTFEHEGRKHELRCFHVKFHVSKEDTLERLLNCSSYDCRLD